MIPFEDDRRRQDPCEGCGEQATYFDSADDFPLSLFCVCGRYIRPAEKGERTRAHRSIWGSAA